MRSRSKLQLSLVASTLLVVLLVVDRSPLSANTDPVVLLQDEPKDGGNFFTEFADESNEYSRAILSMEDSLFSVGAGVVAGTLHKHKTAVQGRSSQMHASQLSAAVGHKEKTDAVKQEDISAKRAAGQVKSQANSVTTASDVKARVAREPSTTNNQAELVTHKRYGARKAQGELDKYFQQLPVWHVSAFHEKDAPKGAPVRHFDTKQAARALDKYFYSRVPTVDDHRSSLKDKAAAKDLAAYYQHIPTHNVNAFHEAKTKFSTAGRLNKYSAKQAAQDLDAYYDAIPLGRHQNAFHEAGKVDHRKSTLATYDAKQADADLEGYFSDGASKKGTGAPATSNQASVGRPAGGQAQARPARVEAMAEQPEPAHGSVHASKDEQAPTDKHSLRSEDSNSGKSKVHTMQADEASFEKELDDATRLGLRTDVEDQHVNPKDEQQVIQAAEKVVASSLIRKVMGKKPDEADLSDDVRPDADEPVVSANDRKRVGYDTQYGLKPALATNVPIEVTPGGTVETDLMSQGARAKQLGMTVKEYQQRMARERAEQEATLAKQAAARKARAERIRKRVEWIRNEPLREAKLQRMEKEKELDEREEALKKWEKKHKKNLEKELAEHHEHLVMASVVEPDGVHPVIREKLLKPAGAAGAAGAALKRKFMKRAPSVQKARNGA